MRLVRSIFAYAGPRALQVTILMVAAAVFEGLGLFLIAPLIAVVTGASTGGFADALRRGFQAVGVQGATERLAALLGAFAVVVAVRAFVIVRRDVAVAELEFGYVEAQRMRIAELVAAAPWPKVSRLRHARVSHLIGSEVQRIATMAHFLLEFAVSLVMLMAQCVLVIMLAPALALPLAVLLAVGALTLLPALRRAHAFGHRVGDANLSLLDSTSQFMAGLKLAISQNLQARYLGEYRQALDQLRNWQLNYIHERSARQAATQVISAIVCALLVMVGFGVLHLAAAALIALIAVVSRMAGPFAMVQQGVRQVAEVLPAFESAGALERELSASPAPARLAASGQRPSGAIVFDDVSFLHEPDAETAEARGVGNLCLRIEPAEFIGITGPSGSGKTTFADLLVGLLEPQSGRITVGGRSLAGAGLEAWRDGVSYVAQDPFLSHDTIRRNLSWARPEADETQMWDALRAAGADGLVRGMPKGLDAVVGERGALVSGGERQRIAIARALLRRPQLLVLDEATGAIDLDGERTILERLSALRPRPTIVLIAHRNESLALCDRVIRIEDGRVLGGGVELPRRAPWAAAAPDFDWSRQPSPQS